MDEEERYEDALRIAGDRGGVIAEAPCKELSEVRLCRVGVEDRSWLLRELELGVLRMGVLTDLVTPGEGEVLSLLLESAIRWATGEEGVSGVSIAVDSESRSKVSASAPASLFVDSSIVLYSE